jgi:hypothetical protein
LNSSLIPVRSSISSTNGVPPERQLLSSIWDKKKHRGSSLRPNKDVGLINQGAIRRGYSTKTTKQKLNQ